MVEASPPLNSCSSVPWPFCFRVSAASQLWQGFVSWRLDCTEDAQRHR